MEAPKLKLYLYHCAVAAIVGLAAGAADLRPAVAFSTFIAAYLASTAILATVRRGYIKAIQKLGDFYKPAAAASLLVFLTCWIIAYNFFQGFPTIVFIDPTDEIGYLHAPSALDMGYNCYYLVSCHKKNAIVLLGKSVEITRSTMKLYIPHTASGVIFCQENRSVKLFSRIYLSPGTSSTLPWCRYHVYYTPQGVVISTPNRNLTVATKPIEVKAENLTLRVMMAEDRVLVVETPCFTIPECNSLNLTSLNCIIMLRGSQLFYFPSKYVLTPAARVDKGLFLYLRGSCEQAGG